MLMAVRWRFAADFAAVVDAIFYFRRVFFLPDGAFIERCHAIWRRLYLMMPPLPPLMPACLRALRAIFLRWFAAMRRARCQRVLFDSAL